MGSLPRMPGRTGVPCMRRTAEGVCGESGSLTRVRAPLSDLKVSAPEGARGCAEFAATAAWAREAPPARSRRRQRLPRPPQRMRPHVPDHHPLTEVIRQKSTARSFMSAPASSPVAEIPNNLTAPLVTSPSRRATQMRPEPPPTVPREVVVRPAEPDDGDGHCGDGPDPPRPQGRRKGGRGPGVQLDRPPGVVRPLPSLPAARRPGAQDGRTGARQGSGEPSDAPLTRPPAPWPATPPRAPGPSPSPPGRRASGTAPAPGPHPPAPSHRTG